MKKVIAGVAAAIALSAYAAAADFGPAPVNYESTAEAYISERLVDPRNARIEFVGAPYRVYADIAGRRDVACWAVDVRVKARTPSGRSGGYLPYTVIFLDGKAVAFEEDIRHVSRV
ncbi:MAG: hypothetical protein AB7P23_06920 [Amphiplicatus sp.]